MSARPTGYPGWASGASGWVAEPAALQKATGWQPNQAPPAAYMNWLQSLAYSWIKYLDDQNRALVFQDDFVGKVNASDTYPVDPHRWSSFDGVTAVPDGNAFGAVAVIGNSAIFAPGLYAQFVPSLPTGAAFSFSTRIRLASGASGGITASEIRAGFDIAKSSGYCFFAAATGVSNWRLVTNTLAAGATSINLGVGPTFTYQQLEMSRDNSGNFTVIIDGTQRFSGQLVGTVANTVSNVGVAGVLYGAGDFHYRLDWLRAWFDRP